MSAQRQHEEIDAGISRVLQAPPSDDVGQSDYHQARTAVELAVFLAEERLAEERLQKGKQELAAKRLSIEQDYNQPIYQKELRCKCI